ncbi:MAG TPA: hypothetical protein VG406_00635 [Isosphaeraceae bacterium]|nr:hypothetical protein [Isosphaeraceae bacterium]
MKTLTWELESRNAIEVRVHHKFIATKPEGPVAHDNCVEHYIEMSRQERFYDIIFQLGDDPTYRITHDSDGLRCATVTYRLDKEARVFRQSGVVVKRHFAIEENSDRMERPNPIQLLYVGRVPLNLALPKATVLGKVETMGRPCIRVLFPRVRWAVAQDHVYDLDEATGLPLKVEAYLEPDDRANRRPVWVWEADSLDAVDGHYLSKNSRQIEYNPETSEKSMNRTYVVEFVKFNGDYPKSTFWPEPAPGVTVLDAIKNETRETPGKPTDETARATPVKNPIRATPPSNWSWIGSRAAFGSGLVLLLLGGGLWWRRR